MNGQMKKYKESMLTTPHVALSPELHKVKIDYHGLIAYAKKKGVSVPELSDEEKNDFILNSSMDEINKARNTTNSVAS